MTSEHSCHQPVRLRWLCFSHSITGFWAYTINPCGMARYASITENRLKAPAIAMAAYTTYKIIMASFNLRKRRISSDSLVRLLRTINFVDALVSILILQNTLVMVNLGSNAMDMLPVAAFSSGVIWAGIQVLSVTAIAGGIMRIKNS